MSTLRPPPLDDDFFEVWGRRYDERNDDEGRYKELIRRVAEELANDASDGAIREQTFRDICLWKWKEWGWACNGDEIEAVDYRKVYVPALKRVAAARVPPWERLALLLHPKLPALGVATASTLAHFIDPNTASIIDVRTAEMLHAASRVASPGTEERHYRPFCEAITRIRSRCRRPWTLRQIDRGLFAWHQLNGGRTR